MSRRRKLALAVFALAAALAGFLAGPRPDDAFVPRPVALPADLDRWLADGEARFTDLRPGAARRILWADPQRRTRTPVALVYVHGFSADRHEVSPLCERIAIALGANLFFTRLEGHGRSDDAMGESTYQGWMQDTLEALAIGRRLGDRVVLIGTSTGGTLATLAALRPEGRDLHALVLISPNYGIPQPTAPLLLWPWGEQIGRLVEGDYHTWVPQNAEHGRHWNTRYPVRALIPLMQAVRAARRAELEALQTPTLVMYSTGDQVIEPARVEEAFERLGSSTRRLVRVDDTGDHNRHVLAGDILSPGTTDRLAGLIVDFIREDAPR